MDPANTAPWYRHRWPWLLMAGPAAVIVAGAHTSWLAFKSSDGLVADDYYKQGLMINRELARERTALERGISATVTAENGGLTLQTTGEVGPGALRLRLVHPTRASEDRLFVLLPQGGDRYRVALPPLAAGRYQAVLETDTWRIEGDLTATQLAAGRAVPLRAR